MASFVELQCNLFHVRENLDKCELVVSLKMTFLTYFSLSVSYAPYAV